MSSVYEFVTNFTLEYQRLNYLSILSIENDITEAYAAKKM